MWVCSVHVTTPKNPKTQPHSFCTSSPISTPSPHSSWLHSANTPHQIYHFFQTKSFGNLFWGSIKMSCEIVKQQNKRQTFFLVGKPRYFSFPNPDTHHGFPPPFSFFFSLSPFLLFRLCLLPSSAMEKGIGTGKERVGGGDTLIPQKSTNHVPPFPLSY